MTIFEGIRTMPMLLGTLVGFFSTDIFSVFLALVFAVMVLFTVRMVRFVRKENRYE